MTLATTCTTMIDIANFLVGVFMGMCTISAVLGFRIDIVKTSYEQKDEYIILTRKEQSSDLSWLDQCVEKKRLEVVRGFEEDAEVVQVNRVMKHFMPCMLYAIFDVVFPSKEKYNLLKRKNAELLEQVDGDYDVYQTAVLAVAGAGEDGSPHINHHYPIGYIL